MRAITANHPHRVALLVHDGLTMFEFGAACEIFGAGRGLELGTEWYEPVVCGPARTITTENGLRMHVPERLAALDRADTIVILPTEELDVASPRTLAALRRAHERGARLVSLCTGAFVLAAAGLLDGRRATTHWTECELLARQYPAVDVDPAVLYVDEGDILTAAGSAASIDLCLHVVACDLGRDIANQLSRLLVVAPHRQGGQAQYIDTPLPSPPGSDLFADTLDWAQGHLDRPITVRQLAARAAMSPRTFARRFAATTGTTPYHWLIAQRLRRAQQLLETTDHAVEAVAEVSGFPDVATFRKHFRSQLHTTPSAYRAAFKADALSPS